MESVTILLFCFLLFVCLWLGIPIQVALALGLCIFLAYGRLKGYGFRALFSMCREGILAAKNILLTFLLIGILTALWRGAGTIPFIVVKSAGLIRPTAMYLMAFLLCSLVSFLTGTSFGTSATIGVICMTMGQRLGCNSSLLGGAILSGAFFGDRCSPVSTSALLVSELTHTDIYHNLAAMAKSAWVPFGLSLAIYFLAGLGSHSQGELPDLDAAFSSSFVLSPVTLLPAVVVLLLALCRLPVKWSMTGSILAALLICLGVQGLRARDCLWMALFGYQAQAPQIGAMLNGGGILSMVRVSLIVCLSSSYAGIFQKTGLLLGIRQAILRLAQRTTPFLGILLTSLITCMLSCNQTLGVMLTAQLCEGLPLSKEELALALEDSAILLAALIPWSIAGAVPLATVGAPTSSMAAAVYLYLVPLWHLALELIGRRRPCLGGGRGGLKKA